MTVLSIHAMEDLADLAKSFFAALPKAVLFVLWVACAFFILPCVFVAGTIYPAWTEWGEGF